MDHVRPEAGFPKPLNALSGTNLLHMVSHELRTPFAVIQSSAELLQMLERASSAGDSCLVSRTAGNILHEVAHVTEILNRITLLSEMQSGKYAQVEEFVDLEDLLCRLLESYFSPWKDGRMADLAISGSPRDVWTDPVMLKLVMRNLLENAFKYSPGGRPPVVRAKFLPECWSVTVRDYGIGIPEKDQPRLFKPFVRASNVGSVPGTGLGLMTVMQLVKRLEGRVRIWSIEGKGTLATVTFGGD